MSKIVGNNKSGSDLAMAIINAMEKDKLLSKRAKVGKNYETILIRHFASWFCKCYELTTGDVIAFGDLSDKVYVELKKTLIKLTEEYYLDEICQWMKVEKWQDLFPNAYQFENELKFKEKMMQIMYVLHNNIGVEQKNEMEKTNNDSENIEHKEVINGNRCLLRKKIFELMKIDYELSHGKIAVLTDKTIENIKKEYEGRVNQELGEQIKVSPEITEKIRIRTQETEKIENRLIREYIDTEDIPLECNVSNPDFVELFRWCKRVYMKEKIDLKNDDTFEKWIKKQRGKLKKRRNREEKMLYAIDKQNGYIY